MSVNSSLDLKLVISKKLPEIQPNNIWLGLHRVKHSCPQALLAIPDIFLDSCIRNWESYCCVLLLANSISLILAENRQNVYNVLERMDILHCCNPGSVS